MSWFTQLTGCPEINGEQVHTDLSVTGPWLNSHRNGKRWRCGDLRIPTLADLRKGREELPNPQIPIEVAEYVGGVQELHVQTTNAHATFQVASQFNLLEMVDSDVTPELGVGIYEKDRTQGPACAIAAGAGTIYRNYFVPLGSQVGQTTERQIDCLEELAKWFRNSERDLWVMRNGYMLPTGQGLKIMGAELAQLNEAELDQVRGKLRVGIQIDTQVTLQNCTHCVTQVYGSAVPISYTDWSDDEWAPVARLVLDAAYEATFCAAVLQAARSDNPNLYLTLLGGGAFGNPLEWILEAINRSLRLFRTSGLRVHIVSYGRSRPEIEALVRKHAAFE